MDQGQRSLDQRDLASAGHRQHPVHQEIVAVAGSPRIDELMRGVLADPRLVFPVMANPRWLHEPNLTRNREILGTLEDGDRADAEQLLAKYPRRRRRHLVDACALRRPQHVS